MRPRTTWRCSWFGSEIPDPEPRGARARVAALPVWRARPYGAFTAAAKLPVR